jgi:hypothetical protein
LRRLYGLVRPFLRFRRGEFSVGLLPSNSFEKVFLRGRRLWHVSVYGQKESKPIRYIPTKV